MCETSTVSQKSQICACKGTKFMGKYNICMDNMHENALFSEEKFFYTAGKNLHDKFQLCEHSYVKWLIFE